MATRRKPKKALIQFGIAAVIAIAVGIGAVFIGITLVSSVSESSNEAKIKAEEEVKKAQKEVAQAKAEAAKLMANQNRAKVVQAAVDIPPGKIIARDMLEAIEVDKNDVGAGSFKNPNEVVGQIVISPIKAGEAINKKKVQSTDGQIFVEDGKRAITIDVDNIGGLNGALSPGMSVDILVTFDAESKGSGGGGSGKANGQMTRTLLQNVKIISAGGGSATSTGSKRGSGNAVTLSVTPQQAEQLVLANETGTFHLALRGFTDARTASVNGTDYQELITGVDRAALVKKMPAAPKKDEGIVPVNYTEDLPEPSGPTAKTGGYKMDIYTGSSMKSVNFQQ